MEINHDPMTNPEGSVTPMNDKTDESPVASNQEKLQGKLNPDTLARSLASTYDAAQTVEANREALKKVSENELEKARQASEHDKNQGE